MVPLSVQSTTPQVMKRVEVFEVRSLSTELGCSLITQITRTLLTGRVVFAEIGEVMVRVRIGSEEPDVVCLRLRGVLPVRGEVPDPNLVAIVVQVMVV